MISTLLKLVLCVGSLLSLLTTEALCQIYTESVTSSAGGQKQSAQSYYMPQMFKFVQDDGTSMIMRFDRDLWISADRKKKEFWQMTFAELETKMKGMGAQRDSAMQQMQQQLESMPPEQRKMVEQMMKKQMSGGGSGGKLEVRKGGPSRTIGGFSCARYAVTEDGKEVLVLWTAKDVREFAAMRGDYEKFARIMAAMRGSQAGSLGRAWTEAMKVIDGFPMETESAGSKTTVTKLEKKSTPSGEFEPAAGSKRVPPPF
ncbi:MAG: hypothetical protein ACREQK_07455 [Candidatus Binatia bacterium]